MQVFCENIAGDKQIGERGIKTDPCVNQINPYNRILTLKMKGNKLVNEDMAKKYAMLIVSIANGNVLQPEDRNMCLDIVGKVKTKKEDDKATAVEKISGVMKRCKINSQDQDHLIIYEQIQKLI